ncbi:MAG: isoprenyl transferase [Lactobacillales bacterium]|jgi:undecaprenyl diphosphate synthase|nr:isoprenyl transferase [Lactobacillales bacterium]
MFRLFSKKSEEVATELTFDSTGAIPKHVAIIMDGNGRWAQKRFLPRVAGHKEGMNTVKTITKYASNLGIKVLTLYAFSTENWKRPDDEVNFLMKLPVDFFDNFVPELVEKNIRVHVMGYLNQLPDFTQDAIARAIEATKNNTGMILNFALNYGSRAEIVTAVQEIAAQVEKGNLLSNEIDEGLLSNHLMTGFFEEELRDPELLVRTSGEERISNFLLWQIAYSEFYFTNELWPDFNEESLERAIASFQSRNRRFGGLSTEKK